MKTKLTVLLALICLTSLCAQVKEQEISTRDKKGHPKLIKFNETKVSDEPQAIKIFLKSLFQPDDQTEFRILKEIQVNERGYKSVKLQQYYKGVKVEFATFNARSKNGELTSTSGEYINLYDMDVHPKLSEQNALQFALKKIGAKEYFWENQENEQALKDEKSDENATYYPKGELVIFDLDPNSPSLTYKFKIDALYPYSSDIVYVNGNTGKVEFKNSLLRFTLGTADTRYSGQKSIETTQLSGGNYSLIDNTRGNGIRVFNLRGQGINYASFVDITDSDNNWTNAEFDNAGKDNAALDVLWGAEMTHDYFQTYHNRNGIDSLGFRIDHYVHADMSYFGYTDDNAFWSGAGRITYGDGDSYLDAVTSLDVVSHEIAHGFYEKAIGTNTYQRESGAINEGLSDIWGAMVEYHMAGTDPNKDTYLIGEEIHLTNAALRSMSNPKSLGHPDTYRGVNWAPATVAEGCVNPIPGSTNGGNDLCGVHINSGVLNHWFYLLSEGSSATDGINDNGDEFNLQGIGKMDAAKIVYEAEIISFEVATDYQEARSFTILAAEELFGVNSIEAIAVNNAWYAVGLGNAINVDYQLTGDENTCYNDATTLILSNVTNKTVTWQVSANIQIVQSSNSSITVKALNNSTRASGFVTANIVGEPPVTKNIWVGKTNVAGKILGPKTVLYGALVNYSTSSSISGATSYQWYLPYPYDPNATTQPNPSQWGIITGGDSRYLTAIVGPNNGLVQVMGVNKCGVGSSKSLYVSIGTPGGDPPGGGGIPVTLGSGSNGNIEVYPNPVTDEFIVSLASNTKSNIQLYDVNGKLVLAKETIKRSEIIKTSNLANGVYFLQIKGETNAIKKIIIKH